MNSEKRTVQSLYTVTDEELMLMSSQNPELRFERNANGTLETGYWKLFFKIWWWVMSNHHNFKGFNPVPSP